jgi:hypothetical protein
MFECRQLQNERKQLIDPLTTDIHFSQDTPELKFAHVMAKPFEIKIINNLFLFWCKVSNFIDLCSD